MVATFAAVAAVFAVAVAVSVIVMFAAVVVPLLLLHLTTQQQNTVQPPKRPRHSITDVILIFILRMDTRRVQWVEPQLAPLRKSGFPKSHFHGGVLANRIAGRNHNQSLMVSLMLDLFYQYAPCLLVFADARVCAYLSVCVCVFGSM